MALTSVGTLSVGFCREGEEGVLKRRMVKGLSDALAGDAAAGFLGFDQVISVRSMSGKRGDDIDTTEVDAASSSNLYVEMEDPAQPRSSGSINNSKTPRRSKYHNPRVVAPSKPIQGFSGKPLVDSEFLQKIYWSKAFDWVCTIFILLGSVLPIIGSDAALGRNTTEIGNQIFLACVSPSAGMLGFAVLMLLSQYDRGVMKELLKNFEFWFVSMELAFATGFSAYNTYFSRGGLYAIASSAYSFSVFLGGIAVLGLDASRVSRRTKGIMNILISLAAWGWAWIWGTDDTWVGKIILTWHPFKPDFKSFISTSLITLAMFTTKYAICAFFFKRDMLLVNFSARVIPTNDIVTNPSPPPEIMTISNKSMAEAATIHSSATPNANDDSRRDEKEAPFLVSRSSEQQEECPQGRYRFPNWSNPKDFQLVTAAGSANHEGNHLSKTTRGMMEGDVDQEISLEVTRYTTETKHTEGEEDGTFLGGKHFKRWESNGAPAPAAARGAADHHQSGSRDLDDEAVLSLLDGPTEDDDDDIGIGDV